jgi:glycosyltransferase involved in cell wall biosynthesis
MYMHENQLTYPLPVDPSTGPMRRQKGERDLHYAFVNYASMLAADRVVFNSRFHREAYLAALPIFLKHFPEHCELASVGEIAGKTEVLPVGVQVDIMKRGGTGPNLPNEPLILWNQRWEYDKNPDQFCRALIAVHDLGLSFRLALCGEAFERQPSAFISAMEKLEPHLVHVGYAEEDLYHNLLICLYETHGQLLEKLSWALRNRQEIREIAEVLGDSLTRYDWALIAPQYDQYFTQVVEGSC